MSLWRMWLEVTKVYRQANNFYDYICPRVAVPSFSIYLDRVTFADSLYILMYKVNNILL